jgi:hypothetical protein
VKFKIGENLPVELVMDLRGLGHDADTVVDEGLRGAADPAVPDAAFAADRICARSTTASPISSATRFTNMPEWSCFDLTPRDEVPSSRLCASGYTKVAEMDLTGRLTIVGPSRIRFRSASCTDAGTVSPRPETGGTAGCGTPAAKIRDRRSSARLWKPISSGTATSRE